MEIDSSLWMFSSILISCFWSDEVRESTSTVRLVIMAELFSLVELTSEIERVKELRFEAYMV